jgi:hypothetical protein
VLTFEAFLWPPAARWWDAWLGAFEQLRGLATPSPAEAAFASCKSHPCAPIFAIFSEGWEHCYGPPPDCQRPCPHPEARRRALNERSPGDAVRGSSVP